MKEEKENAYNQNSFSELTAERVPHGTPGKKSVTSDLRAGAGGSPLPTPLLAELERSLGTQLGDVRTHNNGESAAAADSMNAAAFTVGQDIYFGEGRYDPTSASGKHLIAHEVAHTVQQKGAEPRVDTKLASGGEVGAHEIEAEGFANAFVAGNGAAASVSRGTVATANVFRQSSAAADAANANANANTNANANPELIIRDHGQDAINEFAQAALLSIEGHRRWTSANTIDFLRRTGGNPTLSWSEDAVGRVLTSSITSLPSSIIFRESLREAGRWGAESLAAALGTAAAPGVGTAIGYLIGRVVSVASSAIYGSITGRTSRAENEHNTRMQLGSQIEAREQIISAATRSSLTDHSRLIASFQDRLANVSDQAALDSFAIALHGEAIRIVAINEADRSLFDRMLRTWVLEHAGDEEDANRETSEVEWEAARTEAFGSGDSLDGHPEIFAHQTAAHLRRVGLPPESIAGLLERAERAADADTAMRLFDGNQLEFDRATDSSRFFNFLSPFATRQDRVLAHRAFPYIDGGGITIRIELDLQEADGACYVDFWDYDVRFPVAVIDPTGHEHFLNRPTSDIEFSVSPD